MGTTALHKNRAIRQQALREQLSKGKHVEHVLDIADKLSDPLSTLEPIDVQRYKAAADIKLKLISKYLPDLRSMELTGDQDNPVSITEITRTIIRDNPKDSNA